MVVEPVERLFEGKVVQVHYEIDCAASANVAVPIDEFGSCQ
jgi:hypothetical protein